MLRRIILLFACSYVLAAPGFAAERSDPFRGRAGEETFPFERLTPEERQAYRERLWELKTDAERERFREEERRNLEERGRADRLTTEWRQPEAGAEAERKRWPEDGLRRWPAERDGKSVLRRWAPGSERKGRGTGFGERDRDPETADRSRITAE